MPTTRNHAPLLRKCQARPPGGGLGSLEEGPEFAGQRLLVRHTDLDGTDHAGAVDEHEGRQRVDLIGSLDLGRPIRDGREPTAEARVRETERGVGQIGVADIDAEERDATAREALAEP